MPRGDARGLLLSGIDGSNPLGFLTAVGALRVLDDALSGPVRLGWRLHRGSWNIQNSLGHVVIHLFLGNTITCKTIIN